MLRVGKLTTNTNTSSSTSNTSSTSTCLTLTVMFEGGTLCSYLLHISVVGSGDHPRDEIYLCPSHAPNAVFTYPGYNRQLVIRSLDMKCDESFLIMPVQDYYLSVSNFFKSDHYLIGQGLSSHQHGIMHMRRPCYGGYTRLSRISQIMPLPHLGGGGNLFLENHK